MGFNLAFKGLIFSEVSLGVHETDLPEDARILGMKAGEQFRASVRGKPSIIYDSVLLYEL